MYKENNKGSTRVPLTDDPSLGNWVYKQRKVNNTNSFLLERRTLLELVDFDFGDGKQPPRKDWETMLNRLVMYKENNGSTKVPLKFPEDPLLGNWVKSQRQMFHNNSLILVIAERRTLLQSIDFDWGEGPRGPLKIGKQCSTV